MLVYILCKTDNSLVNLTKIIFPPSIHPFSYQSLPFILFAAIIRRRLMNADSKQKIRQTKPITRAPQRHLLLAPQYYFILFVKLFFFVFLTLRQRMSEISQCNKSCSCGVLGSSLFVLFFFLILILPFHGFVLLFFSLLLLLHLTSPERPGILPCWRLGLQRPCEWCRLLGS